jgi:hypothetical protein
MRTLIILVLAVLLVGGAFLSKPTKQSFKKLVKEHYQAQADSAADKLLLDARMDAYMKGIEYHDKYLFATIERDGKRISTGAFAKWFGELEGIDDVSLLSLPRPGKTP